MPNYNFKKDLKVSESTEKDIARRLYKVYGARLLEINKTNKYDLRVLIQRKETTIEVKEDFSCEKTQNVGLEFSCRGKPSGIEVSQAEYYLYKIHTKDSGIVYLLFKTAILKDMIKNKKYFRIVNGGDKGSNSMNYLFKYEEFIKSGNILPLDRIK